MTSPVRITHFTEKGWGVSETNGKKTEVFSALPGDLVEARFVGKKRKTALAVIQDLLEPSPLRVPPRCSHSFVCGGCSWQNMDYAAQLREKEEYVRSLYRAFPSAAFHAILPSPTLWEYRNKMEFSFSQDSKGERYLGLMLAGGKQRVFNMRDCALCSKWFVEVLHATKAWWEESSVRAYQPFSDRGTLRTLTLREGKKTGDKMAFLTISGNPEYPLPKEQIEKWKTALLRLFTDQEKERLSLFLRIQQIARGSPTQFFELHLHGPDHICEQLEVGGRMLTFKVSPTSFFQPNPLQAEKLYTRALAMVNLSPEDVVYDLYCGAATLAIALAPRVKKVIAIEINPYALFDAEASSELNGVHNLELIQGDVAEKISTQTHHAPALVMVDPPRTGLGTQAVENILKLQPKQILYISCNPKTQAVDVEQLCKGGYRLEALQPVDQFPHTVHIENIALLSRLT